MYKTVHVVPLGISFTPDPSLGNNPASRKSKSSSVTRAIPDEPPLLKTSKPFFLDQHLNKSTHNDEGSDAGFGIQQYRLSSRQCFQHPLVTPTTNSNGFSSIMQRIVVLSMTNADLISSTVGCFPCLGCFFIEKICSQTRMLIFEKTKLSAGKIPCCCSKTQRNVNLPWLGYHPRQQS